MSLSPPPPLTHVWGKARFSSSHAQHCLWRMCWPLAPAPTYTPCFWQWPLLCITHTPPSLVENVLVDSAATQTHTPCVEGNARSLNHMLPLYHCFTPAPTYTPCLGQSPFLFITRPPLLVENVLAASPRSHLHPMFGAKPFPLRHTHACIPCGECAGGLSLQPPSTVVHQAQQHSHMCGQRVGCMYVRAC